MNDTAEQAAQAPVVDRVTQRVAYAGHSYEISADRQSWDGRIYWAWRAKRCSISAWAIISHREFASAEDALADGRRVVGEILES